jgi:cytoskeletal protein CcmA (bactofilin family)
LSNTKPIPDNKANRPNTVSVGDPLPVLGRTAPGAVTVTPATLDGDVVGAGVTIAGDCDVDGEVVGAGVVVVTASVVVVVVASVVVVTGGGGCSTELYA